MEKMVIISAPWVVPVAVPVIRDGSIVVTGGRILDIGRRDDIIGKYPQSSEIKYPCVLMPGLVNAHMHLELTHLAGGFCSLPAQKFTEWIDALIARRAQNKESRDEIVAAFTTALKEQYNSGVALIGDIGNEQYDELDGVAGGLQPKIVRMLEFIGPNKKGCQAAMTNLLHLDENTAATGHAPYSTAPDLLKEIKKRCRRLQHIFSIHACECADEREFLQTGTGCFRDFLEKKSSWDGIFPFSETGFSGTIQYFAHLGLLDDTTLLVHCVHVSAKELLVIKDSGAKICLCPGSNGFLANGHAPVELMVDLGLLPALGSDSAASNQSLDIWREMQILAVNHTRIAPADILAMATMGGAQALLHETEYGSLAVGRSAKFIHVSSPDLRICNDSAHLMDILVANGKPAEIEWVSSVYD
ncbi:hypothetical protein FCL47_05805 [Desulfopila sp. IMCC35006]|nr:hypothetical protein FCL47_05805 [Desulfopila sp. IMCC35006]